MLGKTQTTRGLATAAFAAMLWSAGASFAADATTVEALVEGAEKEGELVVLLLHPTKAENKEKVISAFKEKYDLDIRIDWAPMHPTTLMSRLAAESPSGTFSGDVGAGSIDDLWPSVQKGYVAKFDWEGVFGESLVDIGARTEGVPPEMKDTALAMFDLVYGLIWNPQFVEEVELPSKVEDMADPKWKGRLALNSFHIAPVDYLNYEIGPEKTIALVDKLLANNPVLKAGSGAVGAAVSAGEAPIGTGMAYSTALAMDRGEPIRFRPFSDYTPVLGMKVFVPEYAPHPNAARLFAAWYVTEGMALVGEDEHMGLISNPDSSVGAALAKQIEDSGSKVVSVSSVDQFDQLADTRKPIDKMIAGN